MFDFLVAVVIVVCLSGRQPQGNISRARTVLSPRFLYYSYYINTSEIPSELSRENFISSHVKMTCCLDTWRDYRRYGYITNRARKLTRYFTGVYIMRSLVRYRVEHAKIKFISTCGHVISFISTECDAALVTFRYPTAVGPFWKLVVSFTGQIEISFLLGFNSNVPMSIHSLDFFIRCSPPSPSPPTPLTPTHRK